MRHTYVLQVPMHSWASLLTGEMVLEWNDGTGGDAWQRLPEGMRVVAATYDITYNAVMFLLEHPSFPETADNCIARVVETRVVRVGDGGAQPRRGINFGGRGEVW